VVEAEALHSSSEEPSTAIRLSKVASVLREDIVTALIIVASAVAVVLLTFLAGYIGIGIGSHYS
jgi:hypothetical protein